MAVVETQLQTALQIVSALAALGAAWLWLLSARVVIPTRIERIIFRDDGGDSGDDLSKLTRGLKKQGQLSAFAAMCATGAAVSQAVAILLPIIFS